jgi:hypothetical protein
MEEPADDVVAAKATIAVMSHLVALPYWSGFLTSGTRRKEAKNPLRWDRGTRSSVGGSSTADPAPGGFSSVVDITLSS